jgi:hypothetical protein
MREIAQGGKSGGDQQRKREVFWMPFWVWFSTFAYQVLSEDGFLITPLFL